MYVDGVKILDNDGSSQSATEKCSLSPLAGGVHLLYIEGWSDSDDLSISATYAGPDTLNQSSFIQAVSNPRAPSVIGPVFREYDAQEAIVGSNNFSICAFKADNDLNLLKVDDVNSYYEQVRVFYLTGRCC